MLGPSVGIGRGQETFLAFSADERGITLRYIIALVTTILIVLAIFGAVVAAIGMTDITDWEN